MELIVDGVIYQLQSRGGISRIYSEILPRMCDLDSSLNVDIFRQGAIKQILPQHKRITHRVIPDIRRYMRPGRMWKAAAPSVNECIRNLWIGRGKGKMWHSTYYTLPEKWRGSSVVTVADMIYELYPGCFTRPEDEQLRINKRRCIESADAVICISQATKRDLRQYYNNDSNNIYVVPLAHSNIFQKLDADKNQPAERPFLLYVGARKYYKDFISLIKAYSAWRRKKDVSLIVVGAPWSSHEERFLDEFGIGDNIKLLTSIDDKELCLLYNKASALVHPSLYEGFGITLLEAMACGCPVIASRIPSSLEVAGENPVYFEPGDTDSLINACDTVINEGRDSMRTRGAIAYASLYSWDKTAAETLNIYRKVLK